MTVTSGWCHDLEAGPDGSFHIWPDGDLVEHVLGGDECVCGPTATPVERDDGSIGWLTTHHALDGRE